MNLLIELLRAVPKPTPPKQPLPRSRIENLTAAKIEWRTDVARLLTKPMTAGELGRLWGKSRMTTYHRLTVMEKEKYVCRSGKGRFTLWEKTK